jgi:hypothetical protein
LCFVAQEILNSLRRDPQHDVLRARVCLGWLTFAAEIDAAGEPDAGLKPADDRFDADL